MDPLTPYNPLDKDHLAESIVREFFKGQLFPLPPTESFTGAGIYALYYHGDFPLYREISESWERSKDQATEQPIPIYIGKSDPPGSRKGLFAEEHEDGEEEAKELLTTKPKHRRLHERLRQHSTSIKTTNLNIQDFHCRFMFVDEIWVPLGEARLVEWFRPVWNILIEGFGSKVEGGGRGDTARSVWDIIHPGRKEGLGIQVAPEIERKIIRDIRNAKDLQELRIAIKAHREAKREFARLRKQARADKAKQTPK
jgi:hypothetical protein